MKRILVATDLDARSNSAMARAVRLATRDDARLRIVHVANDPKAPDDAPAAHRRVRTEASIMAEELASQSLDITARIASGNPARAIVREARRFMPDLVVLGAHGDPTLRDLLFSTTAMHVSREIEAPVLVVQSPDRPTYKTVMVAVDDANEAVAALRMATTLAPEGEFFAVHAFMPTLTEMLVGAAGPEEREIALQRQLDEIVGALPAGTARFCHARAREGDPLRVLMDLWMEQRPDLLVIATHARQGIARLAFGNLGDPVLLACTSDVLLVRADAQARSA